MELPQDYKKNLYKAGLILLIILCVYFAVRSLSEFRSYRMMDDYGGNTITLSGHGEVSAVPDIASVYFTIHKEGKTVKEAQDSVALIEKASLDFLKTNNVAEKDIKTTNTSFNPKYEYNQAICPQIPMGAGTAGITVNPSSPYYCPPGKQVLTGYEAFESITVKVRKTDDVGKIMQGLGGLGVSDLNGPNFTIDSEDTLKAEARKKAIAEAKEKAKVLARDLDVKLGKLVSFSEDGDYPTPMYYGKEMMAADAGVASLPAQVPKGENTISSDVILIYEIK